MKTTQTFSILIWANKAKATKTGLPLFARVTIDGRRAEISLKRKVPINKWDSKSGKAHGNSREARELNHYIQEVKSELYRLYHQMASMEEFLSAESIKLRYTGKETPRKSLLQVIEIHNTEMERKVGSEVSKSTLTKFKTLEGKVTSFIKDHQKKSDYFLEQLDYRFITEFEYYLRSLQQLNNNTSMKYIRMLKKVLNETVHKSWIDKNPFSNFKCKYPFLYSNSFQPFIDSFSKMTPVSSITQKSSLGVKLKFSLG